MPLNEEVFANILDDVLDETLDLKKQDRARFCNALMERLAEEDFFPDEDQDGLTAEEFLDLADQEEE